LQHPENLQAPRIKFPFRAWNLKLLWMLEVGAWSFVAVFFSTPALAQDRLKSMPGYDHYQKLNREMTDAVKSGILTVTWTNEGKAFYYQKYGKRYHYDIYARTATEIESTETNTPARTDEPRPGERRRRESGQRGGPGRGRQASSAISPSGQWKAVYRNRNL